MITYFIKRATKKQNIGHVKCIELPSYEELHTFVILFNEVDLRHIQKIKSSLQKDGKQVVLWGSNHTDFSYGHSQSIIIDKSDVSFFSFPKKKFVTEFREIKGDVIVDMTRRYSPVLTYLMTLNNNIPLRIGFQGARVELYDFICNISVNEHVDLLFKELLSFLGKK